MLKQPPVCFFLPAGETAEKICKCLAKLMDCQIEPLVSSKLRYLESFDWRLHQAGLQLQQTGSRLELQDKQSGEIKSVARVKGLAKWPMDLPEGELRTSLCKILDMRALIPIVSVDTKSNMLSLRNADEKTVLRIRVDQYECHAPGVAKKFELPARVWLLPLKGYESELHQLEGLLTEDLERAPATGLLDEALSAIGRKAGDYSSKLDFELHPDMNTDRAMRLILLHLLDTLVNNVEGTKSDIDSEFLHDLRVATRRTRSALSQVKKVFPLAVLEDFKARFAWVGQITGATRDMDVFQLEFSGFHKLLPDRMHASLEPLREFNEERRLSEQRALKRRLNSGQFRDMIKQWREYLLKDPEGGEGTENAGRSVLVVSQERIWKMYRRVLKEGRAISADSPPEDMHELRKSCKKLRYLMEFFRSLYPEKLIGAQIKVLKVLLNNLGDYQDYEVQADKLMNIGEQMKKEGNAPTETLMAMGVLVAGLLERQNQAHKDFASCFAGFDSDENHQAIRTMFKPVIGK